jgi:ATP-dependent RNA helicase DDX51/DBP6
MLIEKIENENGTIYKNKCQIIGIFNCYIVSTPGKIKEHLMKTKGFSIKYLEYLILDEADKLISQKDTLDEISNLIKFYKNENNFTNVSNISNISNIPIDYPFNGLRKLLFSATINNNIGKLSQIELFRPQIFTFLNNTSVNNDTDFVKKYTLPNKLKQYIIKMKNDEYKVLYLNQLLEKIINEDEEKNSKILIFCSSIINCHRLFKLLNIFGFKNTSEYSSLRRKRGLSIFLKKFINSNEMRCLVTTDILGRGLDINEIKYVINFDLPDSIKTYIHSKNNFI